MSNIKKLVLICLLLIYPLTAFGICQSNADLGYGMQSYCGGAIEALVGTTVYEGNGEYAFDTSSGTIQTAIYKYGCLTKEFVESLGMNLEMDTICPNKDKPYINPDDNEDPKCECVECLENEHCKEKSSDSSIEIQCNMETYTCCPENKPLFHDKKCVECYSQENCINRLDGKTQCDMETYTCICPDDKPYFSGDICVECLSNANCSGRTDGKTQCDTDTHTCISGCISLGETCVKDNGESGLCVNEDTSVWPYTLVCCSLDKMVMNFNPIGCPYPPPNQYVECCEDGKVYRGPTGGARCCRSPNVWMSSGFPHGYGDVYPERCDIPVPDEYLVTSCCCPSLDYICNENGECEKID